jgi:hypothetical protein
LELRTFSAVLKFTLQLEDQTAKFYQEASLSEKFTRTSQLFAGLANSSRKRRQALEKAARESVDHSLLEPISGLLEESYATSATFSETVTFADFLAAANQLEERAQKFYLEAGERISFIPGVSRLYKRYAQERAKASASLQSLS